MSAAPVTLAIPCRTDEPALGRTLEGLWAECAAAGVADVTLVCLNGAGLDECPARRDLRQLATAAGRALVDLDVDGADGVPRPFETVTGTLAVARTRRAGKAIAWNVLRTRIATPLAIFADADVALGRATIGRLLDLLAHHPDAVLASPKTTCAARPTWFEAIMAAPYGIDFPNLSGQLYAARTAGLPARMPEDLIEPERWLELEVGCARLVRDPAATVIVRLPGTLRDFYRQRIRIEMGKVQLEHDHPGLAARGNPQPRWRAALRSLSIADLVRLAAYLVLRESAHVIARRRFRRQTVQDAWVQAASTKEWGA